MSKQCWKSFSHTQLLKALSVVNNNYEFLQCCLIDKYFLSEKKLCQTNQNLVTSKVSFEAGQLFLSTQQTNLQDEKNLESRHSQRKYVVNRCYLATWSKVLFTTCYIGYYIVSRTRYSLSTQGRKQQVKASVSRQ